MFRNIRCNTPLWPSEQLCSIDSKGSFILPVQYKAKWKGLKLASFPGPKSVLSITVCHDSKLAGVGRESVLVAVLVAVQRWWYPPGCHWRWIVAPLSVWLRKWHLPSTLCTNTRLTQIFVRMCKQWIPGPSPRHGNKALLKQNVPSTIVLIPVCYSTSCFFPRELDSQMQVLKM